MTGQLCPKCDHWVTRPALHEPEICAAGAYAHEHTADPDASTTCPQLVNNGPALTDSMMFPGASERHRAPASGAARTTPARTAAPRRASAQKA